MIRLDIDLSYLTSHFEIGTQRIDQYGSKSIDEIMKLEAEQGNSSAAMFKTNVLNDPRELLKLFKLSNTRNRHAIIRNMNTNDLIYLMKFLEMKDLLMGLMFFNKNKLLNLIYDLPKEKICQVLFNTMPPEVFLKLVPDKELDRFFNSDKLDREQIMDFIKTIPPDKLNKMMEKYMEKVMNKKPGEMNMDPEQIYKFIEKLPPDKFKEMLTCFEREEKMGLILFLTEKDSKLWTEFTKNALMFPLTQLEKPDLTKAMDKLEPEDISKMLEELPEDFMAIVCTQIDPRIFAEILSKYFQDVLSDIAVGNL